MPEGRREKFTPDPFWICWYQLNIYPYPRNKSDVICVRNSIGPLVLNGSNVPYLRPTSSSIIVLLRGLDLHFSHGRC